MNFIKNSTFKPFNITIILANGKSIQTLIWEVLPRFKVPCLNAETLMTFNLIHIEEIFLFITFLGRQGGIVKFNKDGDAVGRYDIFQYQRVKRSLRNYDEEKDRSRFKCDYINIGDWENDK